MMPRECCDHRCNQGRDCPSRPQIFSPKLFGAAVALVMGCYILALAAAYFLTK